MLLYLVINFYRKFAIIGIKKNITNSGNLATNLATNLEIWLNLAKFGYKIVDLW